MRSNSTAIRWLAKALPSSYARPQTASSCCSASRTTGAKCRVLLARCSRCYPIGNFAHEFAIWNGVRAYGIQIVSVGKDVAWSDLPAWLRLLLPAQAPATPIVVDVEALRPLQRRWREPLPVEQRAAFNDFINGYDAIVVLPGDGPASMACSGLKPPL